MKCVQKNGCVLLSVVVASVMWGGLLSSCGAQESLSPALTRPEMKQRLEALRQRQSRLPLPPPTEAEHASGRSLVNNGRLRSLHLPASWTSFVIAGWGGRAASRPAPQGTTALLNALQAQPDYAFKTRVFWVVSRANDCQYCLGHQELKLRRAGMVEDQIAALDGSWDLQPPAERAAFAAARTLTLSPHRFGVAETGPLLAEFKPAALIDVLYTISRYNAVNRWTSATGIPQDQAFGGDDHPPLDTPTSSLFASLESRVAVRQPEARPEWEPHDEYIGKVAAARTRSPLVPLPDASTASAVLAGDTPGVIPPHWFRALSGLTVATDAWAQRQARIREGESPLELRLLIAWVTARENRAWYAAEHARLRYAAGGRATAVLESFSSLEAAVPPEWAESLRFARKLTSAPQTIVDADVARLRQHFSDRQTAEIIDLTADANAFDRFTEALLLPLEF
ncbi:MAG: carboxymuconolactone decarboxylase family protein [Planctomycetota bacterium]